MENNDAAKKAGCLRRVYVEDKPCFKDEFGLACPIGVSGWRPSEEYLRKLKEIHDGNTIL